MELEYVTCTPASDIDRISVVEVLGTLRQVKLSMVHGCNNIHPQSLMYHPWFTSYLRVVHLCVFHSKNTAL